MTEFISRKYGNEGYEIIIKTDSHEHYRATEDFARRLINHAKPVTDKNVGCNWIPVTEPPKTFGEYNVVVQNESGERHSDYADYDPYANAWKTGLMLYPGDKVTHWMPLPEPPKGE